MDHVSADQPEIIRSHQKDDFFLDKLRNSISACFFDIFGARTYLRFKKELEVLADLCYFCATTCSGLQTLGEEYCSIIQIDKETGKVPSMSKLRMMIFMVCFGPYLGGKVMALLQAKIENLEGAKQMNNFSFEDLFGYIQNASSVLQRIHLAFFYYQGYFYQISKRLIGVRYIVIREFLKDSSAKMSYRYLAVLFGFQLAVTSGRLLYQIFKMIYALTKSQSPAALSSARQEPTHNLHEVTQINSHTKSGLKCPLCLNNITNMTATICGHLFCWECILNWCCAKSECPVCRDGISPSRLIYVRNF